MAKAGEVFGYSPDDPLYDMEVSGVAPQKNIPVTDAIDKGEKEIPPASPYFTKAADSTESAVVEEKPAEEAVVTEEPKGIELTEESLVIDPRDGKQKPFKEIIAMAPLKKDYDAEKFQLAREREDLAREKQIIDQNRPFLDAAIKSPFARTLLNTLSSGDVPEDQAIAAAFAASGKASPFQPQQAVEKDPEPVLPQNFDSDNPEHMAVAARHLEWENRQSAKQMAELMIAPLKQELDAMKRERENERLQMQQAQQRQAQITAHNKQALGSLPKYIEFDPATLSPEQAQQFWTRFDNSAAQLGVKSDHPLSEAEIAGIAARAFPGGKNPFTAQAQQTPAQQTQAQTKIVIEQANKKPLAPGSSGGTPHGGEFPMSESDRIRSLLEGMATGVESRA